MSKLLAVPTHSFRLVCAAAALMGASTLQAQQDAGRLTVEDFRMLEQSRQIMTEPRSVPGMDDAWIKQAMESAARAKPEAERLFEEIRENNPIFSHAKTVQEAQERTNLDYNTLIFVSYSMGDEGLSQALEMASGRPSTVLVMRGIPEGSDLYQGVMRIQRIAARFDPVPNIIIEPTLFKDYEIEAVPTIVALREERIARTTPEGQRFDPSSILPLSESVEIPPLPEIVERVEVARVQGLFDPAWLDRNIEFGDKGDFGVRGPVQQIEERDLIDVMKEKVLAVDWAEKREAAQRNYWKGQHFIELAQAPEERTRHIDATVIATSDIQTSTGEFVARAGDRVNPLQTRPFTQAIVVFDPKNAKQMKMLAERLPAVQREPGVQRTVYIATGIDKEKGWDGYTALTESLQAPVYFLTPDVYSRFELVYTPSIITADDTHFIVREWTPTEESYENQD